MIQRDGGETVDTNLLKDKIKEAGFTISSFADAVNIDRTTLYRRLNREGDDFTISEVNRIIKVLGLDAKTATLIFYPKILNNEIL